MRGELERKRAWKARGANLEFLSSEVHAQLQRQIDLTHRSHSSAGKGVRPKAVRYAVRARVGPLRDGSAPVLTSPAALRGGCSSRMSRETRGPSRCAPPIHHWRGGASLQCRRTSATPFAICAPRWAEPVGPAGQRPLTHGQRVPEGKQRSVNVCAIAAGHRQCHNIAGGYLARTRPRSAFARAAASEGRLPGGLFAAGGHACIGGEGLRAPAGRAQWISSPSPPPLGATAAPARHWAPD